ncbi:MAG: hypothetical protein IT355_01780 [Gemmatimonadaceae bacterium]|nr:hypothetical protein [Gemmatimonadaceae bacterium]
MSSESSMQSFTNHARVVPGYHYVTGLLTLTYLLWSVWHAVSTRSLDAHFQMLGGMALLGNFWYTRAFPLKAQDRVIRLEERLRLTRLVPDDLRPRIDELSARQLIALRFASDAEAPELVRWVLTDGITDTKQIKQRIRSWRADTHRL